MSGPARHFASDNSASIHPEVLAAIAAAGHGVEPVEALVSPNLFANPQIVLAEGEQRWGAVALRHPVAAAVGA